MSLFSDETPKNISSVGLNNHSKFYPAGASKTELLHLLQFMRTGEFKKYDHHCAEKNYEAYGQAEPPHYDLKKIKGFQITLVCGYGDLLSSPDDYHWLAQELEENGNKIDFSEYDLGHMGLMFAEDKSHINYILKDIM